MSETLPGAILWTAQKMQDPELHPLAEGVSAVYSTRCPDKPTGNEDSAALIPAGEGRGVLAVADGLGGSVGGAKASRLAVEQLAESIAKRKSGPLREAVLDGFENADAAVQQLGIGAATTLAAVEIDRDRVRPYHAGDSAILLVGRQGRIKWYSVAHSPTGFGQEAGLLSEIEALCHEHRHVVSNILGARQMRVEVGPLIEMAAHDTLLLCSDGLVDNFLTGELVQRIRKGRLETVMQRLADDAARRMRLGSEVLPGKPDDLTCILFRRNPRPPRRHR